MVFPGSSRASYGFPTELKGGVFSSESVNSVAQARITLSPTDGSSAGYFRQCAGNRAQEEPLAANASKFYSEM